jgi:hypothetical protein
MHSGPREAGERLHTTSCEGEEAVRRLDQGTPVPRMAGSRPCYAVVRPQKRNTMGGTLAASVCGVRGARTRP